MVHLWLVFILCGNHRHVLPHVGVVTVQRERHLTREQRRELYLSCLADGGR